VCECVCVGLCVSVRLRDSGCGGVVWVCEGECV